MSPRYEIIGSSSQRQCVPVVVLLSGFVTLAPKVIPGLGRLQLAQAVRLQVFVTHAVLQKGTGQRCCVNQCFRWSLLPKVLPRLIETRV